MSQNITLKEASKLVNKSVITIRRRIKKTLSTQKNTQMITHGDNGEYLIDKAWILKEYEQVTTQMNTQQVHTDYSNEEVMSSVSKAIEALTNQLEAKDKQINDLIKGQERSDILLRELQQRLPALPSNVSNVQNVSGLTNKQKKTHKKNKTANLVKSVKIPQKKETTKSIKSKNKSGWFGWW